MTLRLRSPRGGTGKVQWKTAGQERFPEQGQGQEFQVPGGGEWQEITVPLPVEGKTGIIRLYLPVTESAVEIQSIRYTRGKTLVKLWDFASIHP